MIASAPIISFIISAGCGRGSKLQDAVALGGEHLGERAIEIVAAEEEVAVGREHLEHLAVDAQDRDVERAAAEVEHADQSDRGRGRSRTRARRRSAR